ncbi:MAG: hypothetical protein LBN20_00080 [Endomicrobium sp.]|jgi:predicted Rossmann fold nucleotide-binding protein DprA/Smf involved in DNA uptake|nr:hypothetical protein [Endomicrobium sp.]
MNKIHSTLGNQDILKLPKTAFFCSRNCPPDLLLKTYDWAIEQERQNECIISGFHSPIEQDILDLLVKNPKQNIIIVPARGKYKTLPKKLKLLINSNRFLLLFYFPETIKSQNLQTCIERNQKIVDLSNKIVFSHISTNGILKETFDYAKRIKKEIMLL